MESKSELQQSQLVRASQPAEAVRVSVPAEVYFNLDKLQSVQKEIFKRFGCPNCKSGLDIIFDLQRQFVVDKDMNIKSVDVKQW
jgi:hypothetical protein